MTDRDLQLPPLNPDHATAALPTERIDMAKELSLLTL